MKAQPQDVTARLHLGRALHLLGKDPEALTHLVKARETQPSNPENSSTCSARVHMKLSLVAYEKLKEMDPDNYRIYQLLGENYEVQGLHGPALSKLQNSPGTESAGPGHLRKGRGPAGCRRRNWPSGCSVSSGNADQPFRLVRPF